ncbi:hypothetical protein BC940DRAFT_291633 [Gongronella butleri]|nr:hypothetical protein BC940DRAFT_291633 [Gongronella butleri]
MAVDDKHVMISIGPNVKSRSKTVVVSTGTRNTAPGKGNPELNQSFLIGTRVKEDEKTIIVCDEPSACTVFKLIATMKDPQKNSTLTEDDLLKIAKKAVPMLSNIINNRVEIMKAGQAIYSNQTSYNGASVDMAELDNLLNDPVARLLLQIALSFEMAQIIVVYNDGDDNCYNRFVAIRNLFTRIFYQPPAFPSMVFDLPKFDGYAPVPFDAFVSHGHPAPRGVCKFLSDTYQISITSDHCALFDPKYEADPNNQAQFVKVCDGWRLIGSRSGVESGYNTRITNCGVRMRMRRHLYLVGVLFFGAIASVAAVNTVRREWLDDAGIDPTSLLSLVIVVLGILTTGIKAAYVEDWAWYDFIRCRYYVKRVGRSSINKIAGYAVDAPQEQQVHFNKKGFSYVRGAKDGPIVADVPVSSAKMINHGVVVVEQTRQKSARSQHAWTPMSVVLPFKGGGVYSMESVGNNVYEVKDLVGDLGIVLTPYNEVWLR